MSAFDPKDETYIAGSKSELHANSLGAKAAVVDLQNMPTPTEIGRFRVKSVLGRGGFGVVYLAQDDDLNRLVAVKVPHRQVVEGDSASWLEEARMVAALDHDNIVPVYDVGRTDDGDLFMVSKYIEGMTLAAQLRRTNFSYQQICELVATIANALHFAHQRGVIHRDVKPDNILIDSDQRPFLVDFGLALREGRIEKAGVQAGTPSYMSPEQARGEGHRVDGRSDVFSLGVVLYRMLTGKKPFTGDSVLDILHQVEFIAPELPRKIIESIPPELDRICLRAIEKRASLRYQTASEFAADLQYYIDKADESISRSSTGGSTGPEPLSNASSGFASTAAGKHTTIPIVEQPKVIPRGLRSFEENDAEFFRQLLPGPYDRNGLPDSIRFWKSRLEESDPEKTFSVGLIYGPSGCGKSSLVKAGLLPVLDEQIVSIYLEASRDDTEANLLRALREEFISIPSSDNLREALSGLRRGLYQSAAKSVVIVIDQFEQWLHAPRTLAECELVQALRQCDGDYVRCVLMVRDDFWMSATRLMRELEVKIVEGWNSAAVDLFDTRHAQKVLHAFGAAHGRIPSQESELTGDQSRFLQEAVNSLANEGLVISVQLAVFAEMMKRREWTPALLKELGGAKGLGVAFLEDTFNGKTAPPERRLHSNAARAVLQALLPSAGSDLKGHRRSEHELMNLCGYSDAPREFAELLGILDGSLRLITPVDNPDQQSLSGAEPKQRYYQLSHDYLVGSLRDWLNQKQQETLRGRAQLVLAERSELWAARKEVKQLPSMLEWVRISFWTRDRERSDGEKQVMKAATRRHTRSLLSALMLLLLVSAGVLWTKSTLDRQHQRELVSEKVAALVTADIEQVPELLDELKIMPGDVVPELNNMLTTQEASSAGKMFASLALLPTDQSQQDFLIGRVVDAKPEEVNLISQRFLQEKLEPSVRLWKTVDSDVTASDGKLRVLGMLAQTDPGSNRWMTTGTFLAQQIVTEPTLQAVAWSQLFDPVATSLSGPLLTIYHDENRAPDERTNAVIVLAEQNQDDPEFLANLILETTPVQFAVVLPNVRKHKDACVPLLKQIIAEPVAPGWEDADIAVYAPATAEDQQIIKAASGTLTEQFAFCQNMPLGQFREFVTSLATKGYCPIGFRPFEKGDEILVAAVWERTGRSWEINFGSSAEDLRIDNDAKAKLGLWPVDVTHWQSKSDTGEVSDMFGAVWLQQWDSGSGATMYVGISEEEHTAQQAAEETLGNPPKSVMKTNSVDNEALFSAINWGLWDRPRMRVEWSVDKDAYEATQSKSVGWMQRDIHIDRGAESSEALMYSGAWWDGGEFETREVHGLDLSAHLTRCAELAKEGFRPWSIAVAAPSSNFVAASIWARPLNEEHKDNVAGRKANAAVALAHLNETDQLWPLMKHQKDPRLRALLIDRLPAYKCPIQLLTDRLTVETDKTIQRAILVALADYDLNALAETQRRALLAEVTQLYQNDPDSGIHGGCEFVLRKAGLEIPALQPTTNVADKNRGWIVDGQGNTLAVIHGPVEFQMGSVPQTKGRLSSQEYLKTRKIPRSFAIATKEVTVEQFLRFREDFDYQRYDSREMNAPVNSTGWVLTAAYCRWLSEQENIPEDQMCYPTLEEIKEKWVKDEPYMKLPEDYLKRTGYRLPTEAEWEYACRSGTTTERYFGQTEQLLSQHAWTAINSGIDGDVRLHPVGMLRPNDFGMFDMLGNVMELCLTRHEWENNTDRLEDTSDPTETTAGVFWREEDRRQLRGGAHLYQPSNARASHRDNHVTPEHPRPYPFIGFRVARTLPSE